jgi:hypothetical protein
MFLKEVHIFLNEEVDSGIQSGSSFIERHRIVSAELVDARVFEVLEMTFFLGEIDYVDVSLLGYQL